MKSAFLFLFCTFYSLAFAETAAGPSTYFTYSPDEKRVLQQADSAYTMSQDELRKWDYVTANAIEDACLDFFERTRIFTYLYVAQEEAVCLSKELKGNFVGSLDPISDKVLSLLLTKYSMPSLYQSDAYSKALAEVVGEKIKERIERESALQLAFVVPAQLKDVFNAGLAVARWIPWFAKPSMAFWPPPPPTPSQPIWKEQIALIKNAQNPMTEEKKQIIYHWAGLGFHWSDDWRSIVNQFLFSRSVPLQKLLKVRMATMTGLYDCIIAYMGCKYHYLVPRPKTIDPSIHYEIALPKHPSYPSGHSTESTVTATIMNKFFPEDADYWRRIAYQCGLSRIWAGIHYPIDDSGGKICGQKVGEKILEINNN